MCFTIIEICAKQICKFRNDAKGFKDRLLRLLLPKNCKNKKGPTQPTISPNFLSWNMEYFDQ